MKKFMILFTTYLFVMLVYLYTMRYTSDDTIELFYQTMGISIIVFSLSPGLIYFFSFKPTQHIIRVIVISILFSFIAMVGYLTLIDIIYFYAGNVV